mgnify:CR=1 FL=1
MTQLIINGITLPKSSNDNYRCYASPQTVQLDMISGRRVSEVRGGKVQIIEWAYDTLDDTVWRPLSAALRSGAAMTVAYLPDDSDTMVSSKFLLTSMTNPSFAFEVDGRAVWHNVSFSLREVRPHD